MEYRIEMKEAFDIFGIETIGSSISDERYQSPAQLWQKCHREGLYEKLFTDSGDLPSFMPQDLCKIHGAEFEIYGGTKVYGYIEIWYPVVRK